MNIDKKIFFIIILSFSVCVSLLANGILVYIILENSEIFQHSLADKKIVEFRNMFAENVFLSEKEIDFDTRLSLETSVRGLNDQEIFSQWQKFVNSKTKEGATIEAKKLLKLLIQKTGV